MDGKEVLASYSHFSEHPSHKGITYRSLGTWLLYSQLGELRMGSATSLLCSHVPNMATEGVGPKRSGSS